MSNSRLRRNVECLVRFSTAYPFRLRGTGLECVYCSESFQLSSDFRAHMHAEHQTFRYEAAFPPNNFTNASYIKADCTDLRCRICSETCPTLQTMALHLQTKHDKPIDLDIDLGVQPFAPDTLACVVCGAKEYSLQTLSRHTQLHFKRYTCETCGKIYATAPALKKHKIYKHTQWNDKMCRKCKATFSTVELMRKHVQESPPCWPRNCHVCGQTFCSWQAKQKHLSEAHAVPKRQHICPICNTEFGEQEVLRRHFRLTHKNEALLCPCCGLVFATAAEFTAHKVTHTKEKQFCCSVCSKGFTRKKYLAQHMRIHSEYKRFECEPCNKTFNQRHAWKLHIKTYHPEISDTEY